MNIIILLTTFNIQNQWAMKVVISEQIKKELDDLFNISYYHIIWNICLMKQKIHHYVK
jgi:hypothetical protein